MEESMIGIGGDYKSGGRTTEPHKCHIPNPLQGRKEEGRMEVSWKLVDQYTAVKFY
jgi:hypothetical protein